MTVRTPLRTFTTGAGRTFAVRVLPVGARYGRTNALVVDDEPLVEFYVTAYADDGDGVDGFGLLGQFLGRYYLSTMLGTDGFGSGEGAMCMDDAVPVWTIDAPTMSKIREWLASVAPAE